MNLKNKSSKYLQDLKKLYQESHDELSHKSGFLLSGADVKRMVIWSQRIGEIEKELQSRS
jgi:hypothetical protein